MHTSYVLLNRLHDNNGRAGVVWQEGELERLSEEVDRQHAMLAEYKTKYQKSQNIQHRMTIDKNNAQMDLKRLRSASCIPL